MNRVPMLFAFVALLFAGLGFATEQKAFDPATFAALQNAGRLVSGRRPTPSAAVWSLDWLTDLTTRY